MWLGLGGLGMWRERMMMKRWTVCEVVEGWLWWMEAWRGWVMCAQMLWKGGEELNKDND